MLACLRSATVFGVDAVAVHVEVDVSFGIPMFTMVGLPDASVRESRDRVRAAIRNSGFEFPSRRVTVNLAPADVRKAGAAFDLPVALGVLAASGLVRCADADGIVLIGELSLDGTIQRTRGVLPIAAAARRDGRRAILLPRANAAEAAVVGGLEVWPVATLAEAAEVLNGRRTPVPYSGGPAVIIQPANPDLAEVRGQLLARRALEIAAAGGHNLLMVGPPGGGKTLLARCLPGILPDLTFQEALESSAIHSVAGTLPPGAGLLRTRPFRAPHHTASDIALVGGGSVPRPGEISLAHNGVLFLDEMPEFDRRVLDPGGCDESLPVRVSRPPCARVPLHAVADRPLHGTHLGSSAGSDRSHGSGAAASRARAVQRQLRRAVRSRSRTRGRGPGQRRHSRRHVRVQLASRSIRR